MYYLGIDLGGTNIAAGVVDEAGNILLKDSVPTLVQRSAREIVADMADLCRSLLKRCNLRVEDVAALGIGSPGLTDDKTGNVVFSANFNWHDVPLLPLLREHFDLEMHMENDANVAALAECICGGMKGAQNAILLTLGTGVGGGIVLDGRVQSGTHGVGGEIGHMTLVLDGEPCPCGNAGCLERYTSAGALLRRGRAAAQADPNGAIARACGGNINRISAKTVIDCAKRGDPAARKIFADYVHALAMGIITLINFIDPEYIALGGGVAAAGDFLLQPLLEEVEKHIFYKTAPHGKVVLATLGNDAGIIGAALYARACMAK